MSDLLLRCSGILAYGLISTLATLALMYIWLLSEQPFFQRCRVFFEDRSDRWYGKLMTCGYCLGSWVIIGGWLFLHFDIHLWTMGWSLLGGLGNLGLFYLAWAVFLVLHKRGMPFREFITAGSLPPGSQADERSENSR